MRRISPTRWKFDVPLETLADQSGLSLSIIKKLSLNHPTVVEWLDDEERYVQELEETLRRMYDLAANLRDRHGDLADEIEIVMEPAERVLGI